MNLIIEKEFPFPSIRNKKSKKMLTLNSYKTIHWSALSKIKNELKQMLINWYIDKSKETKQSLTIVTQIIRHNKRKADAINSAFAVKWMEDVLTDLKYVEDDDKNAIIMLPTIFNKNTKETMLHIWIFDSNISNINSIKNIKE